MAASDESCDGNPDFAVICSFITKFGNDCGVNVTIADLQQMLEDTKNVHEDLAELHIHLLRRGRKRVTKEKWERSLIKFCHEYSSVDAWELERFGYKKAKLSVKLELLKRLLELQFDSNAKFKSEVNKHEAHSLRIPPIGRDIDGQVYWYQLDREYNMRLYRQGPEEDGAWKLLCSNTDHLRNLLANLQKNITKDLLPEDTLKMETDGDDLTSRMSETKPNTIIIKTEKKDATLSAATADSVKSPVKGNDEITLIENENNLPSKPSPTDQEIKPDKDKEMDVTEVVVKKEVSSTPEDPMEVDDCKPEKSGGEKALDVTSKSDIEMSDAEQITDTKKAQLSPVEKDTSKSSQGDSKTIEKHVMHTDNSNISKHSSTKSIPVAEQSTSKDPLIKPSTDKASPSETKNLPSKDVNAPSDATSNAEQIEAKYKGGKIKLYEKWSKEKKLAADAKQSLKSVTHQQQKGEKAVEKSSDGTLSKSKSPILSSGTSQSEEVPMDLSVSFRSDDTPSKGTTESAASDLTSSKKASIPEKTSRNHVSFGEKHPLLPSPEKKYDNVSETPRPFKKKHLSMPVEETTSDLSRKSVIFEVKSNKLLNQFQESSGDSTKKDKISTNSGFSHLQALQNMCSENPMTCFQSSVIRSGSPDKRLKTESGLPNFSLNSSEKSSYNEANCDNISQKYKFSSSQLSGDVKHFSENDVPPLLLKSNIHSGSDISSKETSPQQKSSTVFKSSEVQDSIINSSKNISPSESENLDKQLKDTECSESVSIVTSGKRSPQLLKADSEKFSTFKKHPRTNDHSVASIMEREYKEVSKPNLNESSDKCDNIKGIAGDVSKSSLPTTDRDKIVATDKALNCFDKKSETVLPKICSLQDLSENATKVDKSIDSETNSDVTKVASTQISSEKTTTKVESSISVDTELKSTKIIGNEEADTSCNSDKTKLEKDSLVQSNTSTTKVESGSATLKTQSVNDSKSLPCETDRTCDTAESNNLNCDKSEKNKQCPIVADDSEQPEVSKKSKDSKDIKTEVVSNKLTKENAAIDNSIPLTLSPNKSDEKSIGSIDCKNAPETESKDLHIAVESRTDKVDVATSNEIKNKTCEEENVPSLEISSVKTDPEACEEVGKSRSQKTDSTNEKPSLVPESSGTPAEPSKTIKDSEKKVYDKHSIASIIDKKESGNKLTTNGKVGPKKEAKEPNGSSQTESLSPEVKNSSKQIELGSKNEVAKLSKDESQEGELEALAKDKISKKKDCAPIEETNLSVKVDVDKGKLKEKLSKDKEKYPDSVKTDSNPNPCTSDKLSVPSAGKTCIKTESEIACEDVPTSPKKHTKSKTLEATEQVTNSKQETQDMTLSKIDSEKESISEKSIEIVKGSPSKTDSISDDLTTNTLDENESKTTEMSKENMEVSQKNLEVSKEKVEVSSKEKVEVSFKEKVEVSFKEKVEISSKEKVEISSKEKVEVSSKDKGEVSSKEITEPRDSETSSEKKDIEKPLESKETREDKSAILAAESSVEEKEKSKISIDDAKGKGNEESVDTGEADDKENASLLTKCPVEAEMKIPKKHGAKSEDISEIIPEKRDGNIKKENSAKTTKDSKRKLSKSASKLKEQKTSPESLKKLEKKDKADCSKSPKNDKKCKGIKNVVSTDISNEDNCVDSSIGDKEKEPLSKEVPEKTEAISTDSSKKKSGVSLKTKIKINIKDPLGVYFVLHNACLESKLRHPSFENLKKIPPPSLKSKPKLITTFSMDTTDDVHIIQSVIDTSPTKKKRGRLRQSKNPAPAESKATPNKTNSKSSPKTSTSSKKATIAVSDEKEGFHIPEGFLEILSNTQSDGSSAKKETQRKPRGRKLKISTPSLENSESESTPIKRSRRIQDIQQKKMSELAVEMEREQRILEQLAKKSVKKDVPQKSPIKAKEPKLSRTPKPKFQPPAPEESASNTCMESKRTPRKMNSRSRNMTKMHLLYEDESKDSEFSTSRETEKSKKRRRGRGSNGKKGFKPWDVSSESESTHEELTEEEEEEEHEEVLVFEVNEDEFACEEVEEDSEPIVVRRARTAKKIPEDTNVEEIVVADDKPCLKCGKHDKPEWILLCDKCDSGYHMSCLIPPLMLIPEGDWYCQPCEHIFLCEWIQKELHKLEVVLKQREREELRKQRLAYVGISLDNVLKPEKKEKSDESSREDDKEEDESEEEDSRDVKSSRRRDRYSSSEEDRHKKLYGKRSVRARRTVNYQFKEYDELIASAIGDELVDVKLPEEEAGPKEVDDDEENDSDKAFQAKFPKQKKRKTIRLNDLDFSEDEDSGEEYKRSSGSDSEQTPPPSVSGSDGGSAASGEWRVVKTKGKKPKRKKKRGKRDDSEEDWDDEDDSDTYRPITRRAAQKSISYREISSDDEWDPKPKAVKKRKKFTSSEDSEASYKKKKPKTAPKPKKKRVRKWASSDSSEESERSIDFSESSGSENKWKVKKTSEDSRLKVNINKKVLSSDENDEESQASAPKKRSNKIVSDQEDEEESEEEEGDEEEEEGSSEEEEEDEEEDEEKEGGKASKPEVKDPKAEIKDPKAEIEDPKAEVKDPKPEVKAPKPEVKDPNVEAKPSLQVKVPVKPDAVKVAETQGAVKKDSNVSDAPVEPIKEKIVVSMVQDKPPVRTVKKDATKMVPCVIPYDKSPKSGHGTTPDDESDRESIQNTPKPVTYAKSIPQQYLRKTVPKPPIGVITSTAAPPRPVSKTIPVPDRRPFASSIVQPFSNLDEDSDDEVPLERIPTAVPNPLPTKPLAYERETKYTPAKELPGFTYTAPGEKCFPPTYSNLAPFQDYSSRPSPLKPSLVETYNRSSPSKLTPLDSYTQAGSVKGPYPLKTSLVETYNRSSPSKLTLLDSYSQSSSPKGFISLDSYSEARKKKQHFYGNPGTDQEIGPRPPPPDTYQREIGFPPEPTPFPPSPSTYHRSTPPHVQRDPGTPPRFHSQYPDGYAPPRSPEYYQNSQYYHGEERVPRPSYQPNYAPPEHGGPPYVPNPYVATPVPQPNGGFMIDTLLRARNPEDGEDELTGVTDIVSYITQE